VTSTPGQADGPNAVVGVSLKSYFDYRQTLTWCAQVAELPILAAVRDRAEVFVLPSFPAIAPATAMLAPSGVHVGAQTVSAYASGAHTGDVSATTLVQIGATLALTGHAERRRDCAETDTIVAAQLAAALAAGLCPVVCVGEPQPWPAYEASRWCLRQLAAALSDVPRTACARIIVAYEPVWAIGAQEPAPDEHIRQVCAELSGYLESSPIASSRSAVIYGGSAGPGQLRRLFGPVRGLFLGRFAHNVLGLASVLKDAMQCLHDESIS
jgi:triosephosphate isomerase (TIM)